MIEEVIDALTAKNRTVAGWEGKVSLCDLGYCTAGIDEGDDTSLAIASVVSDLASCLPSFVKDDVTVTAP